MAKNIRVHELAKELGMDNQICVELCEKLNIGTNLKTSSSLPAAQADRVRRRAERDGLVSKSSEDTTKASSAKPSSTRAGSTRAGSTRAGATRRRAAPARQATKPKSTASPASKLPARDEPAKELAQEEVTKEPAKAEVPEKKTATKTGTKTATTKAGTKATSKKAEPEKATDEKTSLQKASAQKPSEEKTTPKKTPTKKATADAISTDTVLSAPVSPDLGPSDATATDTLSEKTLPALSVPESSPETPDSGMSDSGLLDAVSSDAVSSDAVSSDAVSSDAVSSDAVSDPPGGNARGTVSSRPAPTSASGKAIPPPPGRTRHADTQVGSQSPDSQTGTQTPGGQTSRPRRQASRSAAANVDAVFTPQQNRMPSSSTARTKQGKGSGQFRPTVPQRRRRGGRRRRSVEELRPLDIEQLETDTGIIPPEGIVDIDRNSTVAEIAPLLNSTAAEMVKYFMEQGEFISATERLDQDRIQLYAAEIGAEVRIVDSAAAEEEELRKLLDIPDELDDSPNSMSPRPPVVTVMGHVDHGKTTLLDAIRQTSVVKQEAGGITQHIGAYHVDCNGKSITFIDTPGHEAFTAMRLRGANVTDIVVLVVAADDGLMPQTMEAIDHANAAGAPIIVAINKMDIEAANPDRVRQQLAERNLVPEDWGGDTVMDEVSALNGDGLEELLESILVTAEVQELTAAMDRPSEGVVLEAFKDVGRGPVATLLVRNGTLKVGDPVVAGTVHGKIRALLGEDGENVKVAGPSTPVQVLGLSEVATAGDEFVVAPSLKVAEKVSRTRGRRTRDIDLGHDIAVKSIGARLEDIFETVSTGDHVSLNLVLKSDVHGSLEALVSSLKKLERDNLKLSFVRRGVGGITEDDIQLAAASGASIIGFNVRPDSKARQLADKEDVELRLYEVIYQVTEDIEKALAGLLKPEMVEHVTGEAEVREIFRIKGVGRVAGCFVQSGSVRRGSQVRFLREGAIIWRGTVQSLKRFQDDAEEVVAGLECGIGLSDFQDLKEGDVIETFEEREIT